MVAPADIASAIHRITDRTSFLRGLLGDTLEWPIPEAIEELHELGYGWTADDLRACGLERDLLDGHVWQIHLRHGQPWGIFVVEFASDRVYRTVLRRVLRGLVPSRRRREDLPAWSHENLLFLCTTRDCDRFTFAHFRGDKAHMARLATFGWQQGDRHLRTLCEHNLPALAWPEDAGRDGDAWLRRWAQGFDVEAVTKRFFADYGTVFATVEAAVQGVPAGEPRRLYVQRLFNRLMFLWFIQRKGWLRFQGNDNYLRALFDAARAAGEDFLNDRLYWTFFYGLNTAGESYAVHSDAKLRERRGDVPFLNGGLFDLEDDYDVKDRVTIPNDAFAAVFDVFERYNFTVTESTPLDVEVAVDPEMLGKVFEELVTGRHESGSYYTPRPIVAFMCRESLKHSLAGTVSDESAVARFVDEGDPAELHDPEAVLNALRAVKVCDPACGSGAYLLGMMQELLRLREALFATRGLDAVGVYKRKLEIIQNNLYGVDIDVFAVNIAKLRLWLSLAVDFEGATPPPLPNLDFKIECGDSLTGPNPQEVSDLYHKMLIESADELAELKGQFLRSYGDEKKQLSERIYREEARLRAGLGDYGPDGSIDWRVAFAAVLKDGGFDIARAIPPYVRQELFKETKPTLERNFPEVYEGTADLYVYFFARTHQFLRPDGTACFISSNKWLKASYGKPLRGFFAESAWVQSVVDFGHAKQIFQEADVFPSIILFRKPTTNTSPPNTRICVIPRDELRLEDLSQQVKEMGVSIPRGRFTSEPWMLAPSGVVLLMEKVRSLGVALHEFVGVGTLYGVKTGLNEAFIIDTATRNRLVAEHPGSEAVIRKYVRGQDIDRWCCEWSGEWMIFTRRGLNIDKYPAVKRYLKQFQERLEPKPKNWCGEHWPGRKPGNYPWYEIQDTVEYWREFEKPKILYQEIQFHACYSYDDSGMLANNKVFLLPTGDLYLLGVLNSPLMWWYNWRYLPHMKDEALSPGGFLMDMLPIASPSEAIRSQVASAVQRLIAIVRQRYESRHAILEWLRIEMGIEKPSQKLQDVASLDAAALGAEVQKIRGRRKPLTAAQFQALNAMHVRTIAPLQALAAEARQLEQRVADLVNAAYGLTAEEVALIWRTAPPRMPGEAPGT